jgi:SAM-dependent MidA family methyltransferase
MTMAVWENVLGLGVVASILQILGVDVTTLVNFTAAALCLRSCSLECTKLKQRASELQALARLPTGHRAEAAMRATGLWEEAVLAIQRANELVEAYDKSSVFHVLCNSRRMEREMNQMRRRVSNCYKLAVGIHAGVATKSSSSSCV